MKMKTESSLQDSAAKRFANQKVDLKTVFLMPEGFEPLFLTLYFLFVPYLTGVIFIFIFIAKGDLDSFLALDLGAVIAVWAIGYEVIAVTALTVIFYQMYRYTRNAGLQKGRSSAHASIHDTL